MWAYRKAQPTNNLFFSLATYYIYNTFIINLNNYLMKKTLRFYLVCLLMTLCGTAFAKEVTFVPTDFTEVVSQDYSKEKDGITVAVTASTVTNDQLRIFKNQTITISSTVGNITKIVFTCTANGTSKYGPGCFAAQDGYTYENQNGTWEGDEESVTFTASDNQVRVTEIVVTYGVAAPNVAIPTFSPNGATFINSQEVTISAEEGAKIYYTLDGTDPTTESTEYTAPFTLTETTTVKAIAVKGEESSEVASATYTAIPTTATLAELNALENDAAFVYSGEALVVAKPTAKYVYVKDATGSSLIYDTTGEKTTTAEVGKTIAANWTGKVSIYKNLFELVPDNALVMKEGDAAEVTYPEVTAANITAEHINEVVTLKGITGYTVDGKNLTITIGETNVVGYNQFGLEIAAAEEGKTYEMVGAISRYNDNIQFQPIEIKEEAGIVVPEIVNADFSQSTPIDNHLCGYGKDMATNNTTYYGLQDITGWNKVVLSGDNKTAGYPDSGMGGAVFAYGSEWQMKGNNKTAPAAGPNGEAGNALGFFAVWGCGGYYSQDITLPAGKYAITFPIYNQSGTQANESHTGFFVKDSDVKYTVAINTTIGSWVLKTVEFELTEETAGEIRIGYKSTGGGSGANPMIFVDGVRIQSELDAAIDAYNVALLAANAVAADETNSIVTGNELTTLNNVIAANSNINLKSLEAVKTSTTALNEAVAAFTAAKASYQLFIDTKAMVNIEAWPYASTAKKTAVEDIFNSKATNAEEAASKAGALLTAYRSFIESNALAEGVETAADMSAQIAAANADVNTGWTPAIGTNNNEGYTDASGNVCGKYLDGGWSSNAGCNINISRTLSLPAGKYLLSVTARGAVNLTEYKLTVGEKSIDLPFIGATGGVFGRGWNDAFIEFESTGEDLTLNVKAISEATQQWMSINRFRLVRLDGSLDDIKLAAMTEIEALPAGTKLFYYDSQKIENAKSAVNTATTKQDIENAVATAKASQNLPVADEEYCILNKAANSLMLNVADNSVNIAKFATIHIIGVEGEWAIANADASAYIFNTENKWTLKTTDDIANAYVVNFNIVDGGYTIQGANGLFGTDNATEGSAVYANKAQANNGLWDIVTKAEGEVTGIETMKAETAQKGIYNLNGQKVMKAQKGLYIINGKKVVVK